DPAAPAPPADFAHLGAYAGRGFTTGYLDGRRDALTGESARPAGAGPAAAPEEDAPAPATPPPPEAAESAPAAGLEVAAHADGRGGIQWRFAHAGQSCELRTPPRPARRADRAVTVRALAGRLAAEPVQNVPLAQFSCDDAIGDTALPPAAVNQLLRDLSAFLHRTRKTPDIPLRGDLPAAVRQLLVPAAPHPDNRRPLGTPPDRVRLEAERAAPFLDAVPDTAAIVELAAPETLRSLAGRFGAGRVVAALPAVFYEADMPRWHDLAVAAAAAGVTVEVNSWDGWEVARPSGARLEAGPGLMVLNGLAAQKLQELGLTAVTASVEADREQLEALAGSCPAPLSVTLFGRPPLLTSRAEVAAANAGAALADARGVTLRARREGAVTVYRPETPFDWSGLRNPQLRAAHWVADLTAAPDPLAAWRGLGRPAPGSTPFNYARELA
ncbi:MAG: hypothetical protein WC708_19480, partial [Lentisphaeria bacterium]